MTIINSLHILLCCQGNCACRQCCLLLCRKKISPVFKREREEGIMGRRPVPCSAPLTIFGVNSPCVLPSTLPPHHHHLSPPWWCHPQYVITTQISHGHSFSLSQSLWFLTVFSHIFIYKFIKPYQRNKDAKDHWIRHNPRSIWSLFMLSSSI